MTVPSLQRCHERSSHPLLVARFSSTSRRARLQQIRTAMAPMAIGLPTLTAAGAEPQNNVAL